MILSGKQAHVLENLERVEEFPYKLDIQNPKRRYRLDGWECTSQITGLVVRKLICVDTGVLRRLSEHVFVRRERDQDQSPPVTPRLWLTAAPNDRS